MATTDENTDETQTIDDAVFETAELLADEWVNGRGKRLYKLADPLGDHPAIHALTAYEKTIDDDTGETVETETIEGVGHLVPNVYLRNAERQILQRLKDDNPELWDEATVELMLHEFKHYVEDRITNLVEMAHPHDIVDLHLLKEVRVAIDDDQEARKLAEGSSSFNDAEWSAFLWAVQEEATLIDNLIGEDVDTEASRAYAFQPTFEAVPEWRLRAVENHLCGVFKNAPALANVAALLDSDAVSTQAEMADELGKDKSTISQQVSDVEEWQMRARWMCENRVA